MVDLAESSRPIDMITLIEELDRHKDLQAIGDVGYVSSLWMEFPTVRASSTTQDCPRQGAAARLIHARNTAIARAADQSDAAEEVLSDAEAAISSSRKSALAVASWACRRLSASHSAQ